MKIDLIVLLQVLIASQSLFFAIYLNSGKHRKILRNKILSGLLVVLIAIMLFNWIPYYEYSVPNFNLILGLLIGPLIYLLGKTLVIKGFRLSKSHYIHFAPFVIGFIFLTVGNISFKIYAVTIFISMITYIVLSFFEVLKYKQISKLVDGNYDRLKLSWFSIMLWISLFILAANIVSFYLQTNNSISSTNYDVIFLFLLILFLINYIVFQALKYPEIYVNIEEFQIDEITSKKSNVMPEDESEELFAKIEKVLITKQLFLNPDFLITDLSLEVEQPYKKVSQAINKHKRLNFSEFINQYRINFAKNIMAGESGPSKTILEIMYESGFNTKSNFNRSFRKFEGVTPTQFRNSIAIN